MQDVDFMVEKENAILQSSEAHKTQSPTISSSAVDDGTSR